MGVYFHYVNFTRRERFAIDALRGGTKFSNIVRTLAARAFELLLVRGNHPTPRGRGQWTGNSVAIAGEDGVADDEEFEHFAVVVRDGLIARGLLPTGDPDRYQYKVAQLAPLVAESK